MTVDYNIYDLFIKIFAVGLLELMEKNSIPFDDAHVILFSPAGAERLERNPYLKSFAPMIYAAMGLDDVYSLFGEEKYRQETADLKNQIINEINLPSDKWTSYDYLHELLLLITDTGIGNFYKLK